MNFEDLIHRFYKLEAEVGNLEENVFNQRVKVNSLQIKVAKLTKKKQPQLIFTAVINKFKFKILTMELQTQDFVDSILALEDTDTHAAIDATFANIVLTSSDPTIFTADSDVDADGTLDIVGIAPGTASLNVKADATYTDANTQQSVTAPKEANVDVTVSKPAPGAENTDMLVTFGTPKPVPTT
jgi:hypothetical protein